MWNFILVCVKVTPMREAVIPPPMSAYEIHFESQEGVNTCSEIIVLILRYYIVAYMDPEARKLCLSAYTSICID